MWWTLIITSCPYSKREALIYCGWIGHACILRGALVCARAGLTNVRTRIAPDSNAMTYTSEIRFALPLGRHASRLQCAWARVRYSDCVRHSGRIRHSSQYVSASLFKTFTDLQRMSCMAWLSSPYSS